MSGYQKQIRFLTGLAVFMGLLLTVGILCLVNRRSIFIR